MIPTRKEMKMVLPLASAYMTVTEKMKSWECRFFVIVTDLFIEL